MANLTPYSVTELSGAVAVIAGSVAALLVSLFKSRCSEISCLWGACKCKRVLPPEQPVPALADETGGSQQD